MNRSKALGTWAETKVKDYLTDYFPCERKVLAGANDEGDLRGPDLVIEVKAAKRYSIPEWLRETETERANAGVNHCALVVKPVGVGDTRVGEWWAVMPLHHLALVHEERLDLEETVLALRNEVGVLRAALAGVRARDADI